MTVAELSPEAFTALPTRQQCAIWMLREDIDAGRVSAYTSLNDLTPAELADKYLPGDVVKIEFTNDEIGAILSALKEVEAEYGISIYPGGVGGTPRTREEHDAAYDAGQALLRKFHAAWDPKT